MNEKNPLWEEEVRKMAASFQYPPTPDIAAALQPRPRRRSRQFAYAMMSLLLLLAALLAVPPARAALVHIFRVGAVTLFVGEPTATPIASTVAAAPLAARLGEIAEPVTLAEAREAFRPELFTPAELGEPDELWLHEGQWYSAVIFLWRDASGPSQIAYSFYQIDAAEYASKGTKQLEEVTVNGHRAFWIDGPHYFQLQNGSVEPWLSVEGSVLLWWAGDVTYRLEGAASLEEALRIASSLEPAGDAG